MRTKTVDFYYFSGTGNTLLVAKKMKEVFEKNGIAVNLRRIEKSDPGKINPQNTLGLAFPVACFSTFPFVWKFIRALPSCAGTDAFMVDTLGGTSGGIVGPLKRVLKKKGYNSVGAGEIMMPENIFFVKDEDANRKKREEGLKKAEEYAVDLIGGKSKWRRVPILSDIVYFAAVSVMKLWEPKKRRKFFAFKIDKSICTKCKICVELCPVGNIEMKEYPEYRSGCQYCLRCVSFCPVQAIPCFFNRGGKTYRAVKSSELLE